MGRRRTPMLDRIADKYTKNGPLLVAELGRCWPWTGCVHPKGYGRFVNEKAKADWAHRCAWRLWRGEIPKGLLVLHKCDNPGCINPDHLYLGTDADNARDRDARGRAWWQRKARVN